jgi:hypothetical protein
VKKIEFIGASGVGKSTIFSELLKCRAKSELWKTPSEARIELAKKLPLKSNKTNLDTLLLLCLKLNLIPNRHSKMAFRALQKYEKDKIYKSMYRYNDLIDLMLKTTINNSEIEPYRKGKFIEFYMNLLMRDVLFLEDLSENNSIVYDDGIIHNTSGFASEDNIHLMIQKNPNILTEVFPQGVIFCELDMDENYKRRKKRINEGEATVFEKNVNDEDLKGNCEREIENSNKKIILLEKYNIPVLKINMKNPTNKNIDTIRKFINRFQ